jgi:ABC-type uncharacterized transport system
MGLDLLRFLSRGEIWIAGSALLTFLVLTWALRGAPPGQAAEAEEDAEAPRAGYRDRIVAAVVVGLILILAGAFVSIERGILWSLPLFGLGFGLVLTLIVVNQRFRHGSPSLRRTIDFANAFLNSSLLAGTLVVINVIAFRYGGQPLDLTREGTYSLSSTTLKQLISLDRPLTFTLIFGRGPRAIRQRDRVVQLVESYKAVNPRMIQIVTLDQFFDQSRLDELAKRVPELELLRGGGGLVLELGDGTAAEFVVVRSHELFQPVGGDAARAGPDRFESAFTGEDEVTSALIRLREGKKSKVAFTTGHGERSTADLNPGGTGIGNWKARLTKVGCEVIDLDLIQDAIPRELSLLIVVGPKSPFKPEELLKLQAYAIEGRPIILVMGNTESSGLEELLKSFNLEIGKGVLIDPKRIYNRTPWLVFAPLDGATKHPIVDAMGTNRKVLLHSAAPIHVLGTGASAGGKADQVNRDMVPSVLVRGSNFGWAETDLKNQPLRFDPTVDERGPVTVGVAVTHRGSRNAAKASETHDSPRLVLFSSSAMADNIFQEIEPTNLDLLMNAASWLRDRPDTLGLAAKTHVALTLTADPVLQWRLILVPTVTSMLVIIGMGIIVFIARRE